MAGLVTFSGHAREQMRERDLSEEDVAQTVQSPDQVIALGKRQIAQRRVRHGGKECLLRVVCEQAEDRVTVITVYRTSRVSKYWREE